MDKTELLTFELEPALPIPEHLAGEVQSKLAYVDERIARAQVAPDGDAPNGVRITLRLHGPLDEGERAVLKEKVDRVVISMVKGAFKPRVQILEEMPDHPARYQEDPLHALLARGEIHQESQGVYALGPLVTGLIGYFETRFLELASSFGAHQYRFPTLIPAKYLERVNYFQSFPQSLTFVTHLREDLDAIDHFSAHAACEETSGNLNTAPGAFAPIQALLSPAVCYHLYFSLADAPLSNWAPSGGLVATAVGNCFRYESINLTSLERLWNFTMREIIFVGSKEFVLENRELARARVRPILEEIGLAYRVESANDPFFIGEFRKQAAFQSAFGLKFEIRARLPFRELPGASGPATLAVGSYNYHQDFFGRSLDIHLPDGAPAHTGCVAFGLERMAFAFLAQFGLDPMGWPETVRAALYG